jgi:hypothetical protein
MSDEMTSPHQLTPAPVSPMTPGELLFERYAQASAVPLIQWSRAQKH